MLFEFRLFVHLFLCGGGLVVVVFGYHNKVRVRGGSPERIIETPGCVGGGGLGSSGAYEFTRSLAKHQTAARVCQG